jgi:hypothetical protein
MQSGNPANLAAISCFGKPSHEVVTILYKTSSSVNYTSIFLQIRYLQSCYGPVIVGNTTENKAHGQKKVTVSSFVSQIATSNSEVTAAESNLFRFSCPFLPHGSSTGIMLYLHFLSFQNTDNFLM